MCENEYLSQLLVTERLREARARPCARLAPARAAASRRQPKAGRQWPRYRFRTSGLWTLIGWPLAYARTWSKIVLNWCSSPSRST